MRVFSLEVHGRDAAIFSPDTSAQSDGVCRAFFYQQHEGCLLIAGWYNRFFPNLFAVSRLSLFLLVVSLRLHYLAIDPMAAIRFSSAPSLKNGLRW
ncbi:hypothetical protein [Salinicola sp. NYA28a]